MDSHKEKPLITAEMIAEWVAIQADPLKLVSWQHVCKLKEPYLFLTTWESYVRQIIPAVLKDIPAVAPIHPAYIRTIGQVLEQTLLMGYFFGTRRYEKSVRSMAPEIFSDLKPAKPDTTPDTGGFHSGDFIL